MATFLFCGLEQLPPSVDSSNFLLLWTRATSFFFGLEQLPSFVDSSNSLLKSEYCNIVGRSSLCELICTHLTVEELAFWNNSANQIGGIPWKEGSGPLSGDDTSTNSLSHPIPSHLWKRADEGKKGQLKEGCHGLNEISNLACAH